MRERKVEVARRIARAGDKEWNAIAGRIDELAHELDNSEWWEILYKEPDFEEKETGNPAPHKTKHLGYSRAILLARNIGEINRVIGLWENEVAKMTETQSQQDSTNSPRRRSRIPPRLIPPVILAGATGITVYENKASSSWLEGLEETENKLMEYLDRIRRKFDPGSSDWSAGNAELAELLKAQSDTWLGLLLARDYPDMATILLQLDVPRLFLGEAGKNFDDAFKLNPIPSAASPIVFTKPMEALTAFANRARQLLESESGQKAEFRVKLPVVQRRLQINKEGRNKEYITLVKNGVFLLEDISDIPKVRAVDESTAGGWTRRKPNWDMLFRLGNYEVCRLPRV